MDSKTEYGAFSPTVELCHELNRQLPLTIIVQRLRVSVTSLTPVRFFTMQCFIGGHVASVVLVEGLVSPCLSSLFVAAHFSLHNGISYESTITLAICASSAWRETSTFAVLEGCTADVLLPVTWIQ